MANTKIGYSDYVRFVLKAGNSESLFMNFEPGGWADDELELERNKQYHGIFTKLTSKLQFYGDDKDYIYNNYVINGINADLRLTKYVTKDVMSEDGTSTVKWVQRYTALADYNTMVTKGNVLEVNFTSNDLAELIKSHQSDTFELERLESIDGDILEPLELQKINLEGRTIGAVGEQKLQLWQDNFDADGNQYQRIIIGDTGFRSALTEIVTQGTARHNAAQLNGEYNEQDPTNGLAIDAMFFINDAVPGATVDLDMSYNLSGRLRMGSIGTASAQLDLCRYKRRELDADSYDLISSEQIVFEDNLVINQWRYFSASGLASYTELAWNEGLLFRWRATVTGSGPKVLGNFYTQNIKFSTIEYYEASTDISFVFAHDVYDRLMKILTGKKNKFYSKYFGRTELGYAQDGLDENGNVGGGLIGMVSGFWARGFDPETLNYKSMQISLQDQIKSDQTVFNIGIGVETKDFEEVLRIEELKYFYRETTVVSLPNQVTKVKRSVDKALFFSGITVGYNKGGNYENEIGLDEPNTRTESVTPIRKSANKYKKESSNRADEYALEIARRKPQSFFPEEDTRYDEHNWYLDIVRDGENPLASTFKQAFWTDRLEELPSGVLSPQTFRSMLFTPLRILLRHGWVLRAGMEPYVAKFIRYISSVANTELGMKFKGEVERKENSDILVNDLERSRFLPEIIEFEHVVSEDLIDEVFGKTRTLVNGEYEDVQNYYFKMEWFNEDGNIERGYLLSLKPKGNGKWKFLKANEDPLRTI